MHETRVYHVQRLLMSEGQTIRIDLSLYGTEELARDRIKMDMTFLDRPEAQEAMQTLGCTVIHALRRKTEVHP